jgi:hypothetical protein
VGRIINMSKLPWFPPHPRFTSATGRSKWRTGWEWRGREFEEYDVKADRAAFARLRELSGGQSMVPVLAEDGKAIQSGWQGFGCVIHHA